MADEFFKVTGVEATTRQQPFELAAFELGSGWKKSPPKGLTRHQCTTFLLSLLAVTIALQYVATLFVVWRVDDAARQAVLLEFFSDMFGKILPAEIGLVGAATAFYFSGSKDSD